MGYWERRCTVPLNLLSSVRQPVLEPMVIYAVPTEFFEETIMFYGIKRFRGICSRVDRKSLILEFENAPSYFGAPSDAD